MSWVRVWIHAVFSTKNREPIIDKSFREELFAHIKSNAKDKDIPILGINGYVEHVYILFSLNKEMCISKALQLIKGESSYWVYKKGLSSGKFKWQDDY